MGGPRRPQDNFKTEECKKEDARGYPGDADSRLIRERIKGKKRSIPSAFTQSQIEALYVQILFYFVQSIPIVTATYDLSVKVIDK